MKEKRTGGQFRTSIGGQALIEGILMRGPKKQAIVVRSPEGLVREVEELHLIKEPVGQGVYRYAVSVNRARLNVADKLRTIFKESITSVDSAQNMVVIKTLSGLAGGACEALDHMDIAGLVGSLAGENTVFLVMKDTDAAELFCQEIREML